MSNMKMINEVRNNKDDKEKHYFSEEECIAWLDKEIEKETERVLTGKSTTGIRRWALYVMKDMVLFNHEWKNEILDDVRTKLANEISV